MSWLGAEGGGEGGGAGTPTSSPAITNAAALDKEVRLSATPRDRALQDTRADFYSLLVTTDLLEKAYIRNWITSSEYTEQCSNLIAQFRTLSFTLDDVPSFAATYKLECPLALKRLEIGVPATIEHSAKVAAPPQRQAKHVADTVQHFITLMDMLRLNVVAVDQLHPLLTDLIASMDLVVSCIEGRDKLTNWLVTLNKLKAIDSLGEDQVREFTFDLEKVYSTFHKQLGV